ncbi:hypothetical protein Q6A83_00765 [Aliarcobacter skirrowii]|uniref:hypothetical protein n=1 Tax=Aliarcobacter skirrowii TaxID=28200 RepID=UPI0029B0001E|nr:hypothetical protein [Aliarcobacter skirrowii]MDX4049304.1 hypothetical protein [Aliarcobacter skirrowii]
MKLIEIISNSNKIKTIDDLLNHFDLVVELAREDVLKIAKSKRLKFNDFDFTYCDAVEMLKGQLQKSHLRGISRFLKCENISNAASWLIERLLNNMRNITTNKKYKLYCAPSFGKLHENIKSNDELENMLELLELERVNKFSKEEKIKLLKGVWKDAIYDDFDEEDMKYLCNKVDLTIDDVFENKGDLCKLNLKKEQAESGNSQLVIIF